MSLMGPLASLRCAERQCRFSNRPVGVKHFQTIHPHSVDVARGLVLLFGIGTPALVWSFRCQGVCQAANLCPLSVFLFDLKDRFFARLRPGRRAVKVGRCTKPCGVLRLYQAIP